tara:strand:+ start:5857 stop:6165 length:309 start_codon:yes stop_codon:yes gene_type:complete
MKDKVLLVREITYHKIESIDDLKFYTDYDTSKTKSAKDLGFTSIKDVSERLEDFYETKKGEGCGFSLSKETEDHWGEDYAIFNADDKEGMFDWEYSNILTGA